MKIYSDRSADDNRETELAHNVYLQLAEKLFYQDRTLYIYIDNFYTSYEFYTSYIISKLQDSYS